MTRRLILVRHTKSSWDDPMMDDHDRPLNKRGRKSAKALGGWLVEHGYRPDQVLVSTSERTRETWGYLARALAEGPQAELRDELYHAEPEALLNALRAASGEVVMFVAHNPGLAYFAQALMDIPPSDGRFARYPTGATTVIDFDLDDWGRVSWRHGHLVDFVIPRDLVEHD